MIGRVILISNKARFHINDTRLISITYKDGTVTRFSDIYDAPTNKYLRPEDYNLYVTYRNHKDKLCSTLRHLKTAGENNVYEGLLAMLCKEHKRFIEKLVK